MAGKFTRKNYDECALVQQTNQSTAPLELIMDVNKFVNPNNICKPYGDRPMNAAQLVDIESSMMGLDKMASRCDSMKHPFCGENGCLLPSDPRIAPHINPLACSWGRAGDTAVINTNMRMPANPGYNLPNTNNFNGY